MDHCVVWKNRDDTPPDSPAAAELLVAHNAVALVSDGDVPATASLPSSFVVAEVQARGHGDSFGFA